MGPKYSYDWYIRTFQQAKESAEQFILTTEETQFLHAPAEGRWSVAECYSHLIKFGNLYLNNMEPNMAQNYVTTEDIAQPFQPRWITRKVLSFLKPPYKIKVKTVKPMSPDSVSDYNRMELLDKYVNLQDRFIAQLQLGKQQHTDLSAIIVEHPVFAIIKMTLSECFAIAGVHQQRHQWQAEQTMAVIKEKQHQ